MMNDAKGRVNINLARIFPTNKDKDIKIIEKNQDKDQQTKTS